MRVELKVENLGDRTLVEHRKPEQFDVRRMSDDGIVSLRVRGFRTGCAGRTVRLLTPAGGALLPRTS